MENFKNHFKTLNKLFKDSSQFIFNEPLQSWPKSPLFLKSDVFRDLMTLNNEDLKNLDQRPWNPELFTNFPALKEYLTPIHNEINNIVEIANLKSVKIETLGISEKKQHELKKFLRIIKTSSKDTNKFIDVGGGKGHLARELHKMTGAEVNIIEKDDTLIDLGKSILNDLNIKNIDYTQMLFDKNSIKLKKGESILGLHTCGNLAEEIISTALNSPGGIHYNIGCCYLRCYPYTPLSKFAKEQQFSLNKFSLTLATAGDSMNTKGGIDLKRKVKEYRSTLNTILQESFNHSDFEKIGPSKRRVYENDFGSYAHPKLNKIIGEGHGMSINDLNNFFINEENQDRINKIFRLSLLRLHFSRLTELLILLDRAIYIEENGAKCEMIQIFDGKISPRNILLVIKK